MTDELIFTKTGNIIAITLPLSPASADNAGDIIGEAHKTGIAGEWEIIAGDGIDWLPQHQYDDEEAIMRVANTAYHRHQKFIAGGDGEAFVLYARFAGLHAPRNITLRCAADGSHSANSIHPIIQFPRRADAIALCRRLNAGHRIRDCNGKDVALREDWQSAPTRYEVRSMTLRAIRHQHSYDSHHRDPTTGTTPTSG